MVLVDSSVWITYLKSSDAQLAILLESQQAACHEMVLGEVSMGSHQQRALALQMLPLLPTAAAASHDEVMQLVATHRLYALGIGYVDVHLLAAALLHTDMQVWTRDKRLHAAAQKLGIAYSYQLH
jgi:predicted nucleic acid-binding protein